jgi:hypothetical protein
MPLDWLPKVSCFPYEPSGRAVCLFPIKNLTSESSPEMSIKVHLYCSRASLAYISKHFLTHCLINSTGSEPYYQVQLYRQPIFLWQCSVTISCPILWQYTQDHQLTRTEDDLGSLLQRFKSIVSGAYRFLACGKEEHYGKECVLKQTSHLVASKKQRTCVYIQAPSPMPFKPSSVQ